MPKDVGVPEHSKEQLSACLVTAVYDHIIVLYHHMRPVCGTSLHSGVPILLHLISWCSVIMAPHVLVETAVEALLWV